jgi:hypothetical protein
MTFFRTRNIFFRTQLYPLAYPLSGDRKEAFQGGWWRTISGGKMVKISPIYKAILIICGQLRTVGEVSSGGEGSPPHLSYPCVYRLLGETIPFYQDPRSTTADAGGLNEMSCLREPPSPKSPKHSSAQHHPFSFCCRPNRGFPNGSRLGVP